jgi:hypothetical protein
MPSHAALIQALPLHDLMSNPRNRNFFAIRLEKKRQIELAKRNRERITQPNFFPSVPKGNLDAPPSKP